MVDPASAVAAAKEIDDAVGLIGKLVRKLRAEPDIAAAKLSMALDEVVKTYRVVDEAISMYVSLAIDSDALRAKSQQLASLSGGRLAVHVAEGRGHCHEIDRIRWQHLDRWFERAFGKNTGDYQLMNEAFVTLGNADSGLFDRLTDVADQLTADAGELVDLVAQGRADEARAHIGATFGGLRDVQRALVRGTVHLCELKDQFNDIAAAR